METGEPQVRVLLVDDEPPLLKMMSTYLLRLGFAVTTCATTDRACAEIAAQPDGFDIAVLDATMEGMSLEDLARQMLQANPAMRVLGASGYPVDMSALNATAPGRVAFLHKPFTPHMLAAAIRRMLGAEKEESL
ncbi:MAG TPA: response regulator [Bryobacteraceae bacterium]|jgi:two-component system cell cycle sensor histidine kinase/response regulator CckA|nr:response regulator [Bryobacteraceae bacterium]